ncbi:MAG: PH domain-containing protein [Flavobacteriia bacterium]|nr:PH domain-containing protein [Flavobacteriia bacterium]OIP45157.1 MAG: hypothetical protein AUK46_13310 [Flavobacteriaceae bacterium CG2_30_31_66]PIV95348.1 MAG: hypothetical protein COW43_14225 [Flavobacteriaceae bacterium CG17_big_fil_post_rev_8_21_14_2_50_31_13]PIX13115.1 MAG: hypothetical protein COZ74_07965 [Flavobacteriaceae bacterium CG_4_8_14_3_um_filter_31_8]PIY13674.1 MAG: hypothetical protein COZ16_13400 [Flavobacteriaceae bacterium CG_4_10_14_3_um_filter_31_253]PIZ11862.1 MAG: h
MDNATNFSDFRTQSKKGILVIYSNQIYSFIRAFSILLFVFIQKFSKFSSISLSYIYFGFAAVLLFFLVRAFLIFKNFQFKVENNHFILKKGILKKTNVEISFDRIQNINFKQNIIQQIINVYEVNIETAGSSKAEISIKAMTFEQATALKNSITIFDKKNIESDFEIKEKPLLKIGFLELLKVSLTENHLQSLSLLLAIGIGFYQQVQQIFESFGNNELMENYIEKNSVAFQNSVIIILIFSFLLIFLGLISSFVRVILVHFNLIVFIKNDTLEINQGFTTKKSVVLKKNKVQYITISTNPLKKILGISFITFNQAESGISKENTQKIIKIVGCKITQILAIKNLLFPRENLSDFQKNQVDSYFKKRLYIRGFLLLILLNVGFYLVSKNPTIFWLNTILVPIFVFLIHLKYQKRTFLFSDEIFEVNFGSIETHQSMIPFYKIQHVSLHQTIFQARKNVADLVFQTASGKIKIPCIKINEALKMYNFALYKIETSQQSWM